MAVRWGKNMCGVALNTFFKKKIVLLADTAAGSKVVSPGLVNEGIILCIFEDFSGISRAG